MKKIIFASLLLALTLSACAKTNKENKPESNNQSKEVKKMGTIHLTKAEFLSKVANYEANPTEWKYLGDKPCIIDFYASWCGPCKTIAPILEDLAKEYDGQIYIYKINTEEEQELAAAFGIRSIPTLLFCPMGGAPQMAQGAMPKESFKQAINEVLLKKQYISETKAIIWRDN
jgi:thioredoxin